MKGKLVYAFGDSIVYGHTMPEKSFMRIIQEETGILLRMYAVNGATVMKGDNDILTQVANACEDFPDLIVLDGYTNDACEKTLDVLGEIRPERGESIEEDIFDGVTFCGSFEKLFYNIGRKWPGVPVVYVTVHRSGARDWEIQCRLRELVIKMCRKWGAKVADIFMNCDLDTREPQQMQAMIIDGAGSHPNENCCRKYYVPEIIKEMQGILMEG